MVFRITITDEAEAQLRGLPTREQRFIEAAVTTRLLHQPTATSKAIKRLRPNPFAEYELRAGALRVLYNVEGDEVVLLVVGRKSGNTLLVAGQEFHEHQNNPSEPSPGQPPGDAQ